MYSKVTAIHEAGHVAAAIALQRKVYSATIIRAGFLDGSVEHSFGGTKKRERDIDTVISLSGLAAESIFFGRVSWSGGAADEDDAADLVKKNIRRLHRLRRVSEKRTTRYLESLWTAAINLVRQSMNAVQVIAEALLSNGSLGEEDINFFIHREVV